VYGIRDLALLPLLITLVASSLTAKTADLSSQGVFSISINAESSSSRPSRSLDAVEDEFLTLTGFSPGSYPPVAVVIHPASEANQLLPSLRVDCIEGGMTRVQVDLTNPLMNNSANRQCLVTAMLLREYYGTNAPQPGSPIAAFPDWLTHGLGALCHHSTESDSIPANYLQGNVPPSIEDFLVQKPPDPANPSLVDLYDSMAASLFKAGIKGSGGDAFRNWIGHLDPHAPLQNPPPWPPEWELRAVERRWLLIMAENSRQGHSSSISFLGVRETLSQYDQILSEVNTTGHSLSLLRAEKGGDYTAQQLSLRLNSLRLQANPVTLPLLGDTIAFLTKLKHQSPKKLLTEEKKLADLRARILKQSKSIEEYLDWYEAARLQVRSGLFERLLEAPCIPLKKGPVGTYLDTVEARGW